jgi:hypothetical protein
VDARPQIFPLFAKGLGQNAAGQECPAYPIFEIAAFIPAPKAELQR